MDSLHGDGPTLDQLDGEDVYYIIGANKLKAVQKVLHGLPEVSWTPVPKEHLRKGCVAEETCVGWVQCEGWESKRQVFGKRFKREGEMIWNIIGIFTNLPATRLQSESEYSADYAQKIWAMYSSKMALEDYFKDALIDLGGHRAPCKKLSFNRGYYGLLSLAYNLARGVDLIGGLELRKQARKATIRLLGGGPSALNLFHIYWDALARC